MTLCPIAIAVGCKKCPAFSICPLKGVIAPPKVPVSSSETVTLEKLGRSTACAQRFHSCATPFFEIKAAVTPVLNGC